MDELALRKRLDDAVFTGWRDNYPRLREPLTLDDLLQRVTRLSRIEKAAMDYIMCVCEGMPHSRQIKEYEKLEQAANSWKGSP